jgi:periodic tryptophan protein 2
VDVDGFALLINMLKRVVIAHFNFRSRVTALEFSPDNRFFIVATGTKVKIFEAPSASDFKTFAPLVLYKKYGNLHSQDITGATWTSDSRFILTWSNDLTLKLMSLHKLPNFLPLTFTGNKKPIVKAFFTYDCQKLYTIASNGTLLMWKWTAEKSEEAQSVLEY